MLVYFFFHDTLWIKPKLSKTSDSAKKDLSMHNLLWAIVLKVAV